MTEERTEIEGRINPRTRRVRELVLQAAVALLVEEGVAEVTPSRVAERAEVARTTIYRHWPDQRSLLLATIDSLTTPHVVVETAGPLEDDVRAAMVQLRTRITTHDVRSIFGALAAYAPCDEAFSDAKRRLLHQLTRPTQDVLEAAWERGELPPDVDCELEASLLTGPVLYLHLALYGEVTDRFLEIVAGRWLAVQRG